MLWIVREHLKIEGSRNFTLFGSDHPGVREGGFYSSVRDKRRDGRGIFLPLKSLGGLLIQGGKKPACC
jgi:hypothetical protein